MKSYVYLIIAIVAEVIGTMMLKVSDGFTVLWPTIGVIVFFTIAFTSLVLALKTLPLSLVYSVWAGLGTVGAGVAGVLLFNEVLSFVNYIGLIVIVIGVVVMNLSTAEKQVDEQEEVTASH